MIINIRGTSGSGKSHLVRSLMECYDSRLRVMQDGRKQPIGYLLDSSVSGRRLAIPGHYETDCGGCDTITNMEQIFQEVRVAHRVGYDVVFEGLLVSADIQRTLALHTEGLPLLVIALSTPLEECLASVNSRREGAFQRRLERVRAENFAKQRMGHKLLPEPTPRGEVNPRNTESKYRGVQSSMKRLQEAGVRAEWAPRDTALKILKIELGLA